MNFEELTQSILDLVNQEGGAIFSQVLDDQEHTTVSECQDCVNMIAEAIVDNALTPELILTNRSTLLTEFENQQITNIINSIISSIAINVKTDPQFTDLVNSIKTNMVYPLLRRGKTI